MADESLEQPPLKSNNSGTGEAPPPEIAGMGFNWGAFFLTWVWGIAHGVWNSLLFFILYIIWAIALGVKGNDWAWRNRKFQSVEQFKETQAVWARWGIIVFILWVLFGVLMVALGIGAAILGGILKPEDLR